MNIFNKSSRIIVTCQKWLSPYVQQEVAELGFRIVETFPTGVELWGNLNDCIRLNLNLRCASQVMYSLKSFYCDSPEDLYKSLIPLPWEAWIAGDGYFSVTSNVFHPTIRSGMYANVRVKDAIVDRMRKTTGARPDTGSDLRGAVIYLYWKHTSAEVFLDTSGDTLAKHGYRKIPGKAPMLEALAASTILASKWNRRSPFVNPMCGSGTLAIEAALIATNRRPGLLRKNYAFMHLIGYEPEVYDREFRKLTDQVMLPEGLDIIASDISEDAVNIAQINAITAGVAQHIRFSVCDFADTEVPSDVEGVVMFNPEYGERLGEESALQETYSRMGDFLKKACKGYMGYIFTGNLLLAKLIGLKAKRRIEFFTAKIDCRLLEFELYEGTRRVPKEE